jgi:hypothetical protein
MNRISKLLITAAFAVGMVALGSAQSAGPKGGAPQNKNGQVQGGRPGQGQPGGMRRGGAGMFSNPEVEKRLKLTADQKKKIEAASKEMQTSMQKLMAGKDFRSMTDKDREAMRTKMKPITDKFQGVVDKTLTATQKKELEKMRAEMRQRFQNGGGAGRPGAGAGGATKGGTANKGGASKSSGGGTKKAGGGL